MRTDQWRASCQHFLGSRAIRVTRIRPIHKTDSPRVSSRRQLETMKVTRTPRWGRNDPLRTRANPLDQAHIAAAISNPLGLTTPARKMTIGVTANAIASKSMVERHQRAAMANPRLRRSASMKAPTSLMK